MTYCGLFSICRLRLIGLQNNLQSANSRSRYWSFKSEPSCGTCSIVLRLKGTKNSKNTFVTPSLMSSSNVYHGFYYPDMQCAYDDRHPQKKSQEFRYFMKITKIKVADWIGP